jgi:hypothetical protein
MSLSPAQVSHSRRSSLAIHGHKEEEEEEEEEEEFIQNRISGVYSESYAREARS